MGNEVHRYTTTSHQTAVAIYTKIEDNDEDAIVHDADDDGLLRIFRGGKRCGIADSWAEAEEQMRRLQGQQ